MSKIDPYTPTVWLNGSILLIFCLYNRIIVLIAKVIVDDAPLSNAKNPAITLIDNRELPIDHRQSPDRDWENPFASVCSEP